MITIRKFISTTDISRKNQMLIVLYTHKSGGKYTTGFNKKI